MLNRFRVFLPPSYHENTLKKYPVLYMHDGHNLFFPEEAFVGKTWRTEEVLEVLDKMNATEGVIVVGIYPNDRISDMTHCQVRELWPFPCRNAQTGNRYKLPDTRGAGNDGSNGLISRWRRFFLSWLAMAAGIRVSCWPSRTFTERDDLLERISAEPKRPLQIYLDSGWPGTTRSYP